MSVHILKIKHRYFVDVLAGVKRFELRKNDRNFEVGDDIHFVTVDGNEFLREEDNLFRITYVLKGEDAEQYGLQKGYCVLSLVKLYDTRALLKDIKEDIKND